MTSPNTVSVAAAVHRTHHAPGAADDLSGTYTTNAATVVAVSGAYAVIDYNTSTATWPLRATETTDTTRPVRWRGPSTAFPPIGNGYAISGLDEFAIKS